MPESAVRKVTVIPADPKHNQKDIRKQRLRVAPYCRVSTNSEEQLDSYQAQIEYYTEKIAAQQEWTMVDMFADEGKTATSTKRRSERSASAFRHSLLLCSIPILTLWRFVALRVS